MDISLGVKKHRTRENSPVQTQFGCNKAHYSPETKLKTSDVGDI